jgi:hypothetical protein
MREEIAGTHGSDAFMQLGIPSIRVHWRPFAVDFLSAIAPLTNDFAGPNIRNHV